MLHPEGGNAFLPQFWANFPWVTSPKLNMTPSQLPVDRVSGSGSRRCCGPGSQTGTSWLPKYTFRSALASSIGLRRQFQASASFSIRPISLQPLAAEMRGKRWWPGILQLDHPICHWWLASKGWCFCFGRQLETAKKMYRNTDVKRRGPKGTKKNWTRISYFSGWHCQIWDKPQAILNYWPFENGFFGSNSTVKAILISKTSSSSRSFCCWSLWRFWAWQVWILDIWVFPKIGVFPPKWMVYNGKPY